MDRIRRVVVAVNTFLQGTLGVIGFAFTPHLVFLGISENPTALQTLRLAAWTNLSQAVLSGWLVARGDEVTVRVLCGALATYHVLAGFDAWRAVSGAVDVPLAEPVAGPLATHILFAALLALAAALPGRAR